jgi:predicted HicB family RNase H-like nuclease
MTTQKDFIKTALRVPPDLHADLHKAAAQAERGFNAEILFRLRQSFKGRRAQQPQTKVPS